MDQVEEKRMFKGMCFMVNGKMCICVGENEMMCRIGPDEFERALERPGVRPMIHGQRTMKGFIFVSEEAMRSATHFKYFIDASLAYNKIAEAAPKKKKKKK